MIINGFTTFMPATVWQEAVFALAAVIDTHAERCGQWGRIAREHQNTALNGIEAGDWQEAVDALDSACSTVVGAFGFNPLPQAVKTWQAEVEAVVWCDTHDAETPCSTGACGQVS